MKKLVKVPKTCTHLVLPDILNYLESHLDYYRTQKEELSGVMIGDVYIGYYRLSEHEEKNYYKIRVEDDIYEIYYDRIITYKRQKIRGEWHFSADKKMKFSPDESKRMFSQIANIYQKVTKKNHRKLSYIIKKYPYIWGPLLGCLFWYTLSYVFSYSVEKFNDKENPKKTPASDTIRYKETDQDSANINPVNTFIYNARQNTK